jgi:hypothetical protein
VDPAALRQFDARHAGPSFQPWGSEAEGDDRDERAKEARSTAFRAMPAIWLATRTIQFIQTPRSAQLIEY